MTNAKGCVNIPLSSNMVFWGETILRRGHVTPSISYCQPKPQPGNRIYNTSIEYMQKKKVQKVLMYFSKYSINIYKEYAN